MSRPATYFAAYGLKRAGKPNLRNMEKITGEDDELLLSVKILNAATIVALSLKGARLPGIREIT